MEQFNKEGQLVVKGESFQVGELIQSLMYVSGSYLAEFLGGIGLSVPRKLRMGVLKNVLREPVLKTIEERKTLADEIGYRLTWFSSYSDSQLVNLLEWFKSQSLSRTYLEAFWFALLQYLVKEGVSEYDLSRLFKQAKEFEKQGNLPVTRDFNKLINPIFYDEEGEIDGLAPETFRPVMYKSSTLTELREIGDKYNASVPKRLKKNEVLEVILKKLEERGELTKELKEKLENQSILLLERFAKDYDIKVSTELKKEEIIEFILANAKETKAQYYVPSSSAVYETTPEEVKKEPEVTQPVVKEEKEPVIIKETVSMVDSSPQLDKIVLQLEKLTDLLSKKSFDVTVNVPPIEPQITVAAPSGGHAVVESPDNALIQELLKPQPGDFVPEEEDTKVNTRKAKAAKRALLVWAGLLSLIISLASITSAALVYFFPNVLLDLGVPASLLTDQFKLFYALNAGVVGLLTLITSFRLFSKKIGRGEIIFWSIYLILLAPTVFGLIAGILGLVAAAKHKFIEMNTTEEDQQKSELAMVVESLAKSKRKSGGIGRAIFTFFGILSIVIVLVLAIIFTVWILVPDAKNWPFIGDFLRWIYGLIPNPSI